MHKVFVYGTLKRGFPNYYLMEDALTGVGNFYAKATTVDSFPLLISGRYNTPYILDVKGKGKKISGEIFMVDDKKLERLDQFEGHPEYYQRDQVDVQLVEDNGDEKNNKVETCWCYFLKNFKDELLDGPFLDSFTEEHQKNHVKQIDRKEKDTSVARYDVLKS